MMKIIYYLTSDKKNPVKDFINSLENKQKAKVFRIFLAIQQYGLETVVPHIKKLSGLPLWEIRILGKDNIRIVYLVVDNESICVLHGFIKKSQKTPERELNITLSRYQDWKKVQSK